MAAFITEEASRAARTDQDKRGVDKGNFRRRIKTEGNGNFEEL